MEGLVSRERKTSHIRDLEGLNRQLVKKLEQLSRENSRLKKLIGRADAALDPDTESYRDKGSEVDLPPTDSRNKSTKCDVCGGKCKIIDLALINGKAKRYSICQNPDCGIRKKL